MDDFLRSPKALGFYAQGDWDPHLGVCVQWPCPSSRWQDLMPQVYAQSAEIIRQLAQAEPVTVLVRPEDAREAQFTCGRSSGIRFLEVAVTGSWARDTMPVFLIDGVDQTVAATWPTPSWAKAAPGHRPDPVLVRYLEEEFLLKAHDGALALEGGAVSVNGAGALLTTEEYLLNEARNAEHTLTEIEEELALTFGVRRVIWLGGGLRHDVAGGQVGQVAVFADHKTIFASVCEDDANPDRMTLEDNLAQLFQAKDSRGQRFELVEVPLPAAVREGLNGKPLASSYLDFYLANGVVFVPVYGDANDDRAAEIISARYPDRKCVQVDVRVLALGGGALRRFTQPVPAV